MRRPVEYGGVAGGADDDEWEEVQPSEQPRQRKDAEADGCDDVMAHDVPVVVRVHNHH